MPIPIGVISYLLLVMTLAAGICLEWNSVSIPLTN